MDDIPNIDFYRIVPFSFVFMTVGWWGSVFVVAEVFPVR